MVKITFRIPMAVNFKAKTPICIRMLALCFIQQQKEYLGGAVEIFVRMNPVNN